MNRKKKSATINDNNSTVPNPLNLLFKSPKLKVWINAPNGWDVFTGVGKLWIIDLKKGIAKKPIWLNERNLDAPYPEYRTHIKTIEEFLLTFFL